MFDFSEQVVLISGATGSLGGAVTLAFAAAGATLILPDRASDRLSTLFPDLDEQPHLLASGVDVTDAENVAALLEQANARYGKIDVLVHTVGGYRAGKPPHQTALETWDFMLNLNARATFLVNHAVAPYMLARNKGKIINIAARSALQSGANEVAYSASKSAVARITESMAAAYKSHGINVNALLPGTIDTADNREAMPNADHSKWVAPEALAQIVLFLASEAATPINGALIPAYGRS